MGDMDDVDFTYDEFCEQVRHKFPNHPEVELALCAPRQPHERLWRSFRRFMNALAERKRNGLSKKLRMFLLDRAPETLDHDDLMAAAPEAVKDELGRYYEVYRGMRDFGPSL